MAIDGFEWDVPDTQANMEAFGYPGAGEGRAAFPKARVVSVCEVGTNAMVDAEIGPIRGKGRWPTTTPEPSQPVLTVTPPATHTPAHKIVLTTTGVTHPGHAHPE